MLSVQYRSTLDHRVSEKQSRVIEHKRMAALAREDRIDAAARPRLLSRLGRRRGVPATVEPEVTIWLNPVAAAPRAEPARPAVAVAPPPSRVVA